MLRFEIFEKNIVPIDNFNTGKILTFLHFEKNRHLRNRICQVAIFLDFWFLHFLCKDKIINEHRSSVILKQKQHQDNIGWYMVKSVSDPIDNWIIMSYLVSVRPFLRLSARLSFRSSFGPSVRPVLFSNDKNAVYDILKSTKFNKDQKTVKNNPRLTN